MLDFKVAPTFAVSLDLGSSLQMMMQGQIFLPTHTGESSSSESNGKWAWIHLFIKVRGF